MAGLLRLRGHNDHNNKQRTERTEDYRTREISQRKFAQLSITLSLEYIRLLSIGQWPDVLTIVTSCGLGSSTVMVHPIIVPFDIVISELLIKF